jgi:hypothetical protein
MARNLSFETIECPESSINAVNKCYKSWPLGHIISKSSSDVVTLRQTQLPYGQNKILKYQRLSFGTMMLQPIVKKVGL